MGQQTSCRLSWRFVLLLLFSLVIIPIKLHAVLANDNLFWLRQHQERNIKQGSVGVDGITRDRLRDKTQSGHKASMYTSDVSSSTTWTIEAVDAPKYFSNFYSSSRAIAIDSSNNPHIAYGGDHLYYTHYNGSSWVYETVDSSPGVGHYTSIALDTSGKAHISYWDWTNGALKYATNATTSGCDGEAKTVETDTGDFELLKQASKDVTMTVTDGGSCPVANKKASAKVNRAGKKRISIITSSETTDENGAAAFTITAKKKTGKAKVTFKSGGIKKKITVTVVSE